MPDIRPVLVDIPPDYPDFPTPGKIESLINFNSHKIYHKFSPYTDYDTGIGFLKFGAKDPLIWAYPDEGKKGFFGLRKYDSQFLPIGSIPLDVIRITKFMASGRGLLFVAKQFLLQTGNAFNETRIYNPISPIIAAARITHPIRHIEPNLGSLLGSLFGIAPKVTRPAGTVSTSLRTGGSNDAKGLLRSGTAEPAKALLESKWTGAKTGPTGFFKGILNSFKAQFSFLPTDQPYKAKADEGTYGLMIGSDKLDYENQYGVKITFNQSWFAGNTGKGTIRPLSQTPLLNPDKYKSKNIIGIGSPQINYDPKSDKPIKYGKSVGVDSMANVGDFDASEMMVRYSYYADQSDDSTAKHLTKRTNKAAVDKTKDELQKVLNLINGRKMHGNRDDAGVYSIDVDPSSNIISSPKNDIWGYDKISNGIVNEAGSNPPVRYGFGTMASYRKANTRVIENSITDEAYGNSYKTAGSGQFDGINILTVLDDKQFNKNTDKINDGLISGWSEWKPYEDDLIAFYFYDLVNDKYIPFRATTKGINESCTATWDELTFIGRADRLYSYGGFNRTLSFTFTVVINSIIELGPTWQRINYLMSLIKPSNYTKKNISLDSSKSVYNRFMIPPMVILNIGDLYRDQPIIINSIGMTVPDNAVWEILNENNSPDGWNYLANYIKSNKIRWNGKSFGQLPKEVDLNVSCVLLEKERPITGGSHFGHAPRNDEPGDDFDNYYRKTAPDYKLPTAISKNMITPFSHKEKIHRSSEQGILSK